MKNVSKVLRRMESSLDGSLDGLELDNTSDVIEKSLVIQILKDLKILVNEALTESNNLESNVTVSESSLPIIYGILDLPTPFGVQAFAIDGKTGNIIDSHFCSSENFAKSDLGFTDPFMLKWDSFSDEPHSTTSFNAERKKKYMELYPNGYTLLWIGFWRNNSNVIRLMEKHSTILQKIKL